MMLSTRGSGCLTVRLREKYVDIIKIERALGYLMFSLWFKKYSLLYTGCNLWNIAYFSDLENGMILRLQTFSKTRSIAK